MRLDEILMPNRVPVGQGGPYLYHVTTEHGLRSMLKDGKIGYEGDILCLTRDEIYSVSGSHKMEIQIVLNRANLEKTHAVVPHDEIWSDETGEQFSSGESEERIWEHPVPFTSTYVVQVNTSVGLNSAILQRLKELNIPVSKN